MTGDTTTAVPTEPVRSAPRGVAVSGLVFAVLFTASLVLVRLAVPADPTEPGAWLSDADFRTSIRVAMNLIPFSGITFLWFMAVVRNHIGVREDRFFATVFLGSGLLFVAMLFAVAAVARSLMDSFEAGPGRPGWAETYALGRRASYTLMNTFAVKMAAVFMFMTSTIGLRTGMLARWVSYVGYTVGLVMLFVITDFAWIVLLFPGWVALVSLWILIQGSTRHPDRPVEREPAR